MDYVPGHGLLVGKRVLVTAAAGTGIGFATAKRCLEEGASVLVSDAHERRLGETAAELGAPSAACDVTDEQWTKVLDITLNGTFRCTRAALQRLQPQGSGVIVNNASVLGWRAQGQHLYLVDGVRIWL